MSGGKGGVFHGDQFPTFDAESKFAKIQISHFQGVGEGLVETNFLVNAESKFAEIQSSNFQGEGEGVGGNQFPTFDAESKFAKIQSSHFGGGGLV